MMGGKQPHGFTIVETMLFIAISGILLVSAVKLLAGRQASSEFQVGMHQIQYNLETQINHVEEGYYSSASSSSSGYKADFNCLETYSDSGNSPTVTANRIATPIGTNLGCQFVGEAFQFGSEAASGEYIIYPLIGNEYASTKLDAITNLAAANTKSLTNSAAEPDAPGGEYDTIILPYAITVKPLAPASGVNPASVIGFFNINGTTGGAVTTEDIDNNMQVDQAGEDEQDVVAAINGDTWIINASQPAGGYQVCFQSGTTDQHGIITLGQYNDPTTVNLVISDGPC